VMDVLRMIRNCSTLTSSVVNSTPLIFNT
jgi:hypothetical protein